MESVNLKLAFVDESEIDYMLTDLDFFLTDHGINITVMEEFSDYLLVTLSEIECNENMVFEEML